jgi:hypothetical protein
MRSTSRLLIACLALIACRQASAADPATTLYSDPQYGFSLRYPATATIATGDQADGQLDLTATTAVVVKLDPAAFKGTNLGEASVGVGVSSDPSAVAACAAGTAAQGEKPAGALTLGGIKFGRFTFEDAGAGNRYASTSYRAVSGGRCYEIVEFLHWAVLENFSPGTVKAFDRAKIDSALHAITRSFTLTGKPT